MRAAMEEFPPSSLKFLFDEADASNSALLSAGEVKLLTEKLFCPSLTRKLNDEEAAAAFLSMSPSADGKVDFAAFSKWWYNLSLEIMREEDPEAVRGQPRASSAAARAARSRSG